MKTEFYQELQNLINRHSMENDSNTPDWILAKYLENCLKNFNEIINDRERWYGRINENYNIDTQLTIPEFDTTIMIGKNEIPSGQSNVFIGYDENSGQAIFSDKKGSINANEIIDGSRNIYIGTQVGTHCRTGNDSVFIGRPAGSHNSNFSIETQVLINRLNEIGDELLKQIERLKK